MGQAGEDDSDLASKSLRLVDPSVPDLLELNVPSNVKG